MSEAIPMPDPPPESERAAVVPRVVGSPGPWRACPACGKPLVGRQRSACSDRCRAALSRQRKAQAQGERDRRIDALVEQIRRELRGAE